MNKVWEESMHDFVPEDFTTFELNEGQSVMFLEKIHHTEEKKVRGTYYVVGGTPETQISSAVLDENMDVVFNHHNDVQGIILFDAKPTDAPEEYAFLFTNESPGIRVVTFGLHTGETQKSYTLPEWDMDANNNLIDRPKAESSDKVDEDLEFEG